MLEFLTNIFSSPGLLAIITIGVLTWLLLGITNIRVDITGTNDKIESVDKSVKIKMDSMRKESREDHDSLCAKIDRINNKLCMKPSPNRDDDLN